MTWTGLLIVLAVVAVTGGLGWLGHRHPGRHMPPARRFPGARGGRRHDSDAAKALAWLRRLERDSDVTPMAAAQIHLAITGALLDRIQPLARIPAWEPIPPNDGPLPPALQDDDPRYPHLREGQYGDWATGQFAAITLGGQDASATG